MLNSKVIRNVQNRILQPIFSFACSNIWFLDLGAYTPGIKKMFRSYHKYKISRLKVRVLDVIKNWIIG